MKEKSFDFIDTKNVLDKYLDNKLPTRSELYHWLIDIPYLIETSKEVGEELQSFACFYLSTAEPFIDKALDNKYGFRDAVHFINFSVINSLNDSKETKMGMDSIIKIEEKNFIDIIKYFNKEGRFH